MFDLRGKNAIITGSSKGLGKSIATAMALHGANVVISSRKADVCQATADEINNSENQNFKEPSHEFIDKEIYEKFLMFLQFQEEMKKRN